MPEPQTLSLPHVWPCDGCLEQDEEMLIGALQFTGYPHGGETEEMKGEMANGDPGQGKEVDVNRDFVEIGDLLLFRPSEMPALCAYVRGAAKADAGDRPFPEKATFSKCSPISWVKPR